MKLRVTINREVICIDAKESPCTWFIFRSNGVEVKIKLVNGILKTSKVLTDLEIEYLNNNLR